MSTAPSDPAKLALSVEAAAESLSISRDTFDRHVLGELKVIRVGSRILVPVRELERYVERQSVRPLAEWLR